MYGPNRDEKLYLGEPGLGFAPVAAAGAVGGAIKGISNLFGGPSYASAVKRVKDAKQYAMRGDSTPRKYSPKSATAVAKPPLQYLTDIAGITANGSRYPEARAAARNALVALAQKGPSGIKEQAAAAINASAGAEAAYAAPAPVSPLGGLGTPLLIGGAALAAFMLLRKRGR